MGKVTILPETTKSPITLIGRRAGICWGRDVSDDGLNYDRGADCIASEHGRTLEFPDVHLLLDGYSARVIREWYTHIGCLPTRLQESTRYIDYRAFKYVTPPRIGKSVEATNVYFDTMKMISKSCDALAKMGVPREDIAMMLPLGMSTRVVDKRNMRNLIDMSRNRMCARAYWEFRELFSDICRELSNYSDEWKTIVESQMKPKCEVYGFCPEKNGCGRKPRRTDA